LRIFFALVVDQAKNERPFIDLYYQVVADEPLWNPTKSLRIEGRRITLEGGRPFLVEWPI
jgi:hypothetical protein